MANPEELLYTQDQALGSPGPTVAPMARGNSYLPMFRVGDSLSQELGYNLSGVGV